jgi:DNA-binding MarR family transcriptional regulator
MGPKPRVEVGGSLQRFGLERDRMRAALARRARISETDLDALEHLEADGPLTQRELGERLSITSGAVTMLVDRLEAAGWVARRPHESDRRYTVLELSAKAAQDTPPVLAAYHTAIQDLVANTPLQQRQIIARFLQAAAGAARTATEQLHEPPPARARTPRG